MGENRFQFNEWVINFGSKAEDEASWDKHSIYRLPMGYADPNRSKAYTPQTVSFGPYHHGHDQLQPMEKHKFRALHRFLNRTGKPLQHYAAALEQVAQKLMDCYKDLDDAWKDQGLFLQLMIVDGCFMSEILTRLRDSNENDYAGNDPIFSKHGILHTKARIKRDMLMIENQIPLLVLKMLLTDEQGREPSGQYINSLVLNFFAVGDQEHFEALGLHVLDVVRKSMLHRPWEQTGLPEPMDPIWSATELKAAGIDFKESTTNSLTDIEFENGILRLPQIIIDDATESKFLNMIAFEHLHIGTGAEVSSYLSFMDHIIDSEKDVILLSKKKIIKNFVGTDKTVAELFNGLAHDVSIDPRSHLNSVYQDVTDYCDSGWHRELANLRQTYLRSPWALISFLVGILAVCLSVTSFIYSTINFMESHAKSSYISQLPSSSGLQVLS